MAGDWIKMRTELRTHPKIVHILSAVRQHDVGTKSDTFRVIGGLHAVWAIFDAHSVDGRLPGYTLDALDEGIGWTGFARAMQSVGWLDQDGDQGLVLPEFSEHNGKSAKRRAEDLKRKREEREAEKNSEDLRKQCGQIADKTRTESGLDREIEIDSKEQEHVEGPTDLLLPAPATAVADCPYLEIIEAYHEALPMLPQVRVHTEQRRQVVRRHWRSDPEKQDVEWWRRFFGYVSKSDFLTGRKGDWHGCCFDWLLKPANFAKTIEGNYENRGQE